MSGLALKEDYDLVEEKKAYYPNNYKGISLTVGTASQTNHPATYLYPERFNTAPLTEFRGEQKNHVLDKPLLVKVYKEGDVFFAENESLILSGSGSSREEAIRDFLMHVEYFYNFYRRQNESSLLGDAIRLKKIYDNLFVVT